MMEQILENQAAAQNPNPAMGVEEEPIQEEVPPLAPQEQAPPVVNVAQAVEEDLSEDYLKYLRRFQGMKPSKFGGSPDPDVAEGWIAEMEKYFDGLRCRESYKVDLAGLQLIGDAEQWFKTLKRNAVLNNREVTWVHLRNLFMRNISAAPLRG